MGAIPRNSKPKLTHSVCRIPCDELHKFRSSRESVLENFSTSFGLFLRDLAKKRVTNQARASSSGQS